MCIRDSSYIALVYIVHLEALKLDLTGLEKAPSHVTLMQKLIGFLFGFLAFVALGGIVYYGLGWIGDAFPGMTLYGAMGIFLVAYLILIAVSAKHDDLTLDDPESPLLVLPKPSEVAVTGLYYLLPIIILLWCILIERLSPALSAFWASMAMIFLSLIHISEPTRPY